MATSSTSSLGFRYHRQKPEGDVAAGSLFQLLPIPRFSSQRRTAAEINAFVRVNFADARTVSSAAALSGNSGVCSCILKLLTDRTDDGPTLVSPLLQVALFGSQYKLGAPIVDSRVSHQPVTNEWLTGYILETFFVVLLDISVFNVFETALQRVCSVISDIRHEFSDIGHAEVTQIFREGTNHGCQHEDLNTKSRPGKFEQITPEKGCKVAPLASSLRVYVYQSTSNRVYRVGCFHCKCMGRELGSSRNRQR